MLNICNIVIVGGEGDLAFRKLYPALFSLHRENLLNECTKVIGFGRGKYSPEKFLSNMHAWTKKSDYVEEVEDSVWKSFCQRVVHFVGDATDPADLKRLREELGPDEMVFYLSTPPSILSLIHI